MNRLILIQHCESKHHVTREARLWPDSKNGLTELGKRQASSIADCVRGLIGLQDCRIYTSAMRRAVETAEIVGTALDRESVVIPGLHEFNGHFALLRDSNGEEWEFERPDDSSFDWRPFAGAETWREFHERVCQGMHLVERMTPDKSWPMVILHGGSLSNAVVWWLGLELDVLESRAPYSGSPGSLTVLGKDRSGEPVIELLNDIAHLP